MTESSVFHAPFSSQRIILAPLRGVTQLTFRRCLQEHFGGVDSAVSPFLTTVAGEKIKATHLADILPEANASLPLVPQIIGKNPKEFKVLLTAIRDLGYARCDLNAGCPWPMIIKKKRGAGLLKDADLLRKMLDAGCEIMPGGISVKVRLGIDTPDLLLQRMEIFNSYPLAELTIHARTANQRYEGEVNLDAFGECLAVSVNPVVYNGDICSCENLEKLQKRFPSVSGWMIGRGLVTRPSLALEFRVQSSESKVVPGADDRAVCPHTASEMEHNSMLRLPPLVSDMSAKYREFVLDYGERTRSELFGPASFLGRMKEFWSYHHMAYVNGRQLWLALRRSSQYADYDSLLNAFDWKLR